MSMPLSLSIKLKQLNVKLEIEFSESYLIYLILTKSLNQPNKIRTIRYILTYNFWIMERKQSHS